MPDVSEASRRDGVRNGNRLDLLLGLFGFVDGNHRHRHNPDDNVPPVGTTYEDRMIALWRNWDGPGPPPGFNAFVQVEGARLWTADRLGRGPVLPPYQLDRGLLLPPYRLEHELVLPPYPVSGESDESDDDDDVPDLIDPEEPDPWREDYLEYILAQRDCAARRSSANLPIIHCSRHLPCNDCILHPGATAISVYWQCMADDRLAIELYVYLTNDREPDRANWVPPSPTSAVRHLPRPRLFFGPPAPPRAQPGADARASTHASSASSTQSNLPPSPPPPSPTNEHLAASSPPSAAQQPSVFGPSHSPPVYEDEVPDYEV